MTDLELQRRRVILQQQFKQETIAADEQTFRTLYSAWLEKRLIQLMYMDEGVI